MRAYTTVTQVSKKKFSKVVGLSLEKEIFNYINTHSPKNEKGEVRFDVIGSVKNGLNIKFVSNGKYKFPSKLYSKNAETLVKLPEKYWGEKFDAPKTSINLNYEFIDSVMFGSKNVLTLLTHSAPTHLTKNRELRKTVNRYAAKKVVSKAPKPENKPTSFGKVYNAPITAGSQVDELRAAIKRVNELSSVVGADLTVSNGEIKGSIKLSV